MPKNEILINKTYECNLKAETIINFIMNMNHYDLQPPYQRNFVWNLKKKVSLITSIVANNHVNSIHLAKQKSTDKKWIVIDGKQRLSTIFEFVNDGFCISYKSVNFKNWSTFQKISTGNLKRFTQNQVDDAREFCAAFNSFNINVIQYSELTLKEQAEVFERINQSENLTTNEKIFGVNYFVKGFTNYIYNELFNNSKLTFIKYLNGEHSSNARCHWDRMIYEWLILSHGPNFNTGYSALEIGEQGLIGSIKKPGFIYQSNSHIASKLSKNWEYIKFSKDELNTLNLNKFLLNLKFSLQYISEFMKKDHTQSGDKIELKKYKRVTYFYFCLFVLVNLNEKSFTQSSLSKEWEKFYLLWKSWNTTQQNDKNFWKNTNYNSKGTKMRMEWLNKEAQTINITFLDSAEKLSSAKKESLKNIIENSNLTDEKTGQPITLNNKAIDHIKPLSLNNNSGLSITTQYSNRAKSNSNEKIGYELIKKD